MIATGACAPYRRIAEVAAATHDLAFASGRKVLGAASVLIPHHGVSAEAGAVPPAAAHSAGDGDEAYAGTAP